ncbi:MAG: FmdE family protein [Terriglobia bacterium]|jgi:formylmethanofuran dehydrogenase subunit E
MVVETDRCEPVVVELVIGCRLGNRTLIFKGWGKTPARSTWTGSLFAGRVRVKRPG